MKIDFKKQKIKVLQLTDCHLSYPISKKSKIEIQMIMKLEMPDIVVFSGDLFHKYHNVCDTNSLIEDFIIFFDQFNVKYVYCFGNHDGELTMLERDIFTKFINKSSSFIGEIGSDLSTRFHPNDAMYRDERIGNFVLDVNYGNNRRSKIAMLDSGRYSETGNYGSITKNQVDYIRNLLKGINCPLLMFFHIPLIEHKLLYDAYLIDGKRREDDCYQNENSGLYKMLEELNVPTYVYCGHDHINDYTVKKENIRLGITPGFCVESYNIPDVRGYRIFELGDEVVTKVKRIESI